MNDPYRTRYYKAPSQCRRKSVVDENSSRRKSAVDELTIYCIVDEMTVDELTVDELTLDDLTWYHSIFCHVLTSDGA